MSRTAVVIPLYNHERFIVDTLHSVLSQTRPPERIIIVDDGSRDGSVEQVRNLNESSITLVEQENGGAHTALNRGISLADDCDVVAILNSDDRYLPERLERILRTLDSRPEVQLLCTGLSLIDDTNSPLPPSEPRNHWFQAAWSPASGDLTLPEWLGLCNFVGTTSNFVARRAWLLEHPFRAYRYVHDYYLLVLAAAQGELHIVHEPLLEYRVHGSNTISTKPENLARELIVMNLDLLRAFAPLQADPAIRARTAAYFRTAWANVSAFRMDVFQSLIAELAAALDADKQQRILDKVLGLPELAQFPNKASVNLHSNAETLGECSGLAERVAQLSKELKETQSARKAAEKQLAAQRILAANIWLRLGAFLGSRACKDFLGRTRGLSVE